MLVAKSICRLFKIFQFKISIYSTHLSHMGSLLISSAWFLNQEVSDTETVLLYSVLPVDCYNGGEKWNLGPVFYLQPQQKQHAIIHVYHVFDTYICFWLHKHYTQFSFIKVSLKWLVYSKHYKGMWKWQYILFGILIHAKIYSWNVLCWLWIGSQCYHF